VYLAWTALFFFDAVVRASMRGARGEAPPYGHFPWLSPKGHFERKVVPSNEPRVIAVVVCHNGRPFLRETFRGLAKQTRPIDDVMVVDTGSTDGSSEWARSRLGEDAVLAVRGQFGRAVMAALRDPRSAGMEWVWLLHDDSAPEPEALERLLAEAASRPSAAILGPKLLSWSSPNHLQEVGWAVDRTGRAVSPVEDDEIDQGQHDQVRETFFVSSAGMMIRRSALLQVGGFDERMPAFRDDLDLCWRTHLHGGRVLVVPGARVRHFAAATSRVRKDRAVSHPRYLTERHTMAALLKATSLRRLPLMFLLAILGGGLRALGLALTGRPGDALQILWAWGWNVKELPVTIVHRRRLQRRRKIDDAALAGLRAPGGQPLRALLRGMLDLVYGDVGEHVAQTPSGAEEQDMPAPGAQVGRIIASHPVAFAVAGFALLMLVSLRSLMFAPAIAGGALGVFPAAGQDFLREFVAAFHQVGLGSTHAASPSLALLGGLATLTLDKALLAQKLLLWLALPLAAATCTRALRVLVPSLSARAVAGLLYASSPLAIGALAQGRLGELAFLVLAPPVLAQVVLAVRSEQPREPWRPALRFLVLGAVAVTMYPPASVVLLMVAALTIAGAVVLAPAGDRGPAIRRSLLLGGGLVGALVLQFPFTGQILSGAALRSTGTALATPGFADLLQLRPGGPGLPGGTIGTLIGPLYPALALAALFFIPTGYRRQTFFLLAGMLAACTAATLQAHGLPPRIATEWPAGLMIPGAVCWAAATGLALAGLGAALGQGGLRLRRVGAAVLALLALATGLLIAGVLVRGSWSPVTSVGSPSLPATVRQSEGRVLWLAGRADHGVDFAVTGSGGRTVLDSGLIGDGRARRALQSVVTDIVQARTHEAGTMLQLFGVGYVAVRPGPEADRLVDLVARQQELRSRPTDQAGLFQGPVTEPSAWIVQGEPPAEVRGVLTGPALVPVPGLGAVFSGRSGAKLPARATAQVQGASATLAEGPNPGPATTESAGSGSATLVLPVPAGRAWRASAGGTALEPTTVFGWAQGFKLPAGASAGALEVRRGGQQQRMVFLVLEGLLVLMAVATMARPTKVAPPVAPMALDDTTTTDLRLATLAARGGAR
jgi:GT2 family glycosyltransferase